ncbi:MULTISPECIES: isochorismatase family protein [unclassified Microbacterium]|uniref:isochorismatase family protein n=1 Tax=unclassified Microbacterium TaxID=2609290 RepID=UPI000EAA396B|nr:MULTISPECIES: isochorismatase family protein [unclassified Microbacterium]MBT2485289.1 isochorismatase family protein [Microbacterium sp. ISL-108]RKN68103.1 isochorismatase family protein [Microbacterium sp. CGR2]
MSAPRRALVVIDAQQEYFEGLLPMQYPERNESIARIRAAIDAAEQNGIPVVLVQHELPADAPVFAAGSATHGNHPDVAAYEESATKRVSKHFSSVFDGTDLAAWLREQGIDTITLVGYMTNNCVLSSAASAEPLGFAVEVLSDATGAIDIANEAGRVSAQQVHATLMALLHSNWAAVAQVDAWSGALDAGETLPKSDLVTSAAQGREAR